jgi:hypothetical protein
MSRLAFLALPAWIALCTPVLAQSGSLQVLPQVVEMNFPAGYTVYTDEGKVVKTVPGPSFATIKAQTSGKSFAPDEVYLSDWSFDRMQKGEKPNWIVPNAAQLAPATRQLAPPDAPNRLIIYPTARQLNIPEGYSLFSDEGEQIKSVPGPASVTVKAESSGKSFAKGKAYLSDWSYNQFQQGKKPNWIVIRERIWWEGLPSFERATGKLRELAISDTRGVRFQHTYPDGHASVKSSRGMVVAPNAPNTAPRGFEDVALYPDAIMGQFPSGYTVYDETGAPVRFVEGPVTMLLRGKVSFSETPDDNPSSNRMTLYLPESSYQAVSTPKPIDLIGPGEYAAHIDVYAGPFRASRDVWSMFEKELPRLEWLNNDAWDEIDAYNGAGVVSDVVLAHHPLTYSIFKTLGEGYSPVDGKRKWREPWVVHGCSESLEMPSGMGMFLRASLFDMLAGLPARERDWYDQSLPGIYQAVADVFRRDMEAHVTTTSLASREVLEVPHQAIYLEFYRSPFVLLQENGGIDGTYTRNFSRFLSDKESSSATPEIVNRPSYYGVRVYKEDECIEDIPLFGAVDFEIFVELLLRNYTKRAAGLSLESSDEWLRGFCETVYKEVFGKMSGHFSDVETIYWKGEGYFNLLPLDLIAVSFGEKEGTGDVPIIELADADAMVKVSSFRQRLREDGAMLVANPDYSGVGKSFAASNVFDDEVRKLVTRAFSKRMLSFKDLPGAEVEVTRLRSALEAWGIQKVDVLQGVDASEHAVLEAIDRTGMAHFATHGFYLDLSVADEKEGKQVLKELKNSTNPYFRSGLALAGANTTLDQWAKGRVTGSSTDGVLLASEVKELDLTNLSLLVLSACSTAEGKPVDGKSVASLRDAFLQAGVETLVSTLWDIPDDFAVKLMGDFYEHLLGGDTPSIALWRAKKDNFLELRKNTGFAESMVKVAPFVAVTQAAKPD